MRFCEFQYWACNIKHLTAKTEFVSYLAREFVTLNHFLPSRMIEAYPKREVPYVHSARLQPAWKYWTRVKDFLFFFMISMKGGCYKRGGHRLHRYEPLLRRPAGTQPQILPKAFAGPDIFT